MQCPIFAIVLDDAAERLAAKNLQQPKHLVLNTDNTPAETKNVTMFTYCAWVVYIGKADTIDLAQGQVGHTHNEEDIKGRIVSRGGGGGHSGNPGTSGGSSGGSGDGCGGGSGGVFVFRGSEI